MSWRWTSAALTPVSMVCVWMVICPTTACATMGFQDPGGCTDWSACELCVHMCLSLMWAACLFLECGLKMAEMVCKSGH